MEDTKKKTYKLKLEHEKGKWQRQTLSSSSEVKLAAD